MLSGCMTPGTIGSPHGASARAGDYIVTIIAAQEPHLIEISGRGVKGNGYRLSLLLISVHDGSRRVVPVARNVDISNARILGDDPVRGMVWFQVQETIAYDYRRNRVLTGRELPHGGGPASPTRLSDPSSVHKYLEAAGPELRNAAHYKASYIRGSAPGLYTYLTRPGLNGTVVIATATAPSWTLETGLFQIDQVLPSPEVLAIIGTRPPVSGEISEPLLMLIDPKTGRAATHSLRVQ